MNHSTPIVLDYWNFTVFLPTSVLVHLFTIIILSELYSHIVHNSAVKPHFQEVWINKAHQNFFRAFKAKPPAPTCLDNDQISNQIRRYCKADLYLSSLSLCASILQSAPLGQGASRLLQIFCLMRYGIWKALGPARAVALLSINRNSESNARVSWKGGTKSHTGFLSSAEKSSPLQIPKMINSSCGIINRSF